MRIADDERRADGLVLQRVAGGVEQDVIHRPDTQRVPRRRSESDGEGLARRDSRRHRALLHNTFIRVEQDKPRRGRCLPGGVLQTHIHMDIAAGRKIRKRPGIWQQRSPQEHIPPDAMVGLRILVIATSPIGVKGSSDDITLAIGIEQRRRIAVLIAREECDCVGRVGREVPIHQPIDVLLAEAGDSLMVLREVRRRAETGLVFSPTVAP